MKMEYSHITTCGFQKDFWSYRTSWTLDQISAPRDFCSFPRYKYLPPLVGQCTLTFISSASINIFHLQILISSLAFYHWDPYLMSSQYMWDLLRTKFQWDRVAAVVALLSYSFKIYFNIILPFKTRFFKWPLSYGFFAPKISMHFSSPPYELYSPPMSPSIWSFV